MGPDESRAYPWVRARGPDIMNELVAFAGPMLVLAAIACGWTAEAVSPARSYGFLADMGLGLGGSVLLAGALYGVNAFGPIGLVAIFLIGVVGGAIAIVAQRMFWQSAAV